MVCPHCNKALLDNENIVIAQGNVYHEKCLKVRTMAAYGYPYECPACHGEGKVVETYNAYPSGLPDSGWVDQPGYRDVACTLCRGRGYNKRGYKPKMIQQGWE